MRPSSRSERLQSTDSGPGLEPGILTPRDVTALPLGHPVTVSRYKVTTMDSPVLVKSPLGLLSNVLSPDGLESSHSSGSVNVANYSNGHHRWGLNDRHGLDHFLLVDLGAGSVHLPHDVSHAGLVAHEGSQVDRLAGVVLGEGLALSLVALGTLLWQKSFRTMARRLKLSVRLK